MTMTRDEFEQPLRSAAEDHDDGRLRDVGARVGLFVVAGLVLLAVIAGLGWAHYRANVSEDPRVELSTVVSGYRAPAQAGGAPVHAVNVTNARGTPQPSGTAAVPPLP
jgi:hypothetical protein